MKPNNNYARSLKLQVKCSYASSMENGEDSEGGECKGRGGRGREQTQACSPAPLASTALGH